MRILYITQWFDPEPNVIKGPAFVRALEAAGHEVTVVTGIPNYPHGRFYPGYRLRPIQREYLGGVEVIRLALYPSHDASTFRRSLNYLSFFVSALAFVLVRAGRYDVIYAYHPPITVGLAATLGASVWRRPLLLDVQDLWPDTLAATGMRGAARLGGAIGVICSMVYRRAERIVVQSEGMRAALIARGVAPAKLATIRNWAKADRQARRQAARAEDAMFALVYGGNLGLAQGLSTVADAAELLARSGVRAELWLYGDGLEAEALRKRARELPNLHVEPRVDEEAAVALFEGADALLLVLRDDPLFAITIPSKLQFYLAMGRPIVAAVAGEAAELLRASKAAIVVPPGRPEALAHAIREIAAMPPAEREAMGRAGRAFYETCFSFERGVAETLTQIAALRPRPEPRRIRVPA
jgi:glycosyltransferase involved in cell wall biosynthesis